jgi:transcriptional regulator with XRE-family HTH domain
MRFVILTVYNIDVSVVCRYYTVASESVSMAVIDPIYGDVGGLIKAGRRRAGLTQEALAEGIGLTRTSVNNIEHGRQAIQIHTLYTIAGVLGLDPLALLPMPKAAETGALDKQLPKKMAQSDRDWVKRVLAIPESK